MRKIAMLSVLALAFSAAGALAQERSEPPREQKGPPPQAYEDCRGKQAGDAVQHTTPEGVVAATCEETPQGLAARPTQRPERPGDSRPPADKGAQDRSERGKGGADRPSQDGKGGGYSIAQALSDRAQLTTIAYSGLAFLTGDFGSSTFIPPGKVSDFFGFQYMRDIDAAGKGHNPMFLDRIAGNVVAILSEAQRKLFEDAAREQEGLVEQIARKRFPLIAAFHRELAGDLPPGTAGLDRTAVVAYGADLFALDATLAYRRAKVFGAAATSLTSAQKAALGRLKFGDFATWPEVGQDEARRLRPRGASKLVSVGYMTLASEFFSWYAGSVEADTYFCPERHGTYFGGFYLKDMPAMGKRDYDISTSITGDAGSAFVDLLTASQRARFTGVLDRQRKALAEIVEVRRATATRLRGFLRGAGPTEQEIVALGRRYGELDGALAYEYATTFAAIAKSLDAQQKEKLRALRSLQSREVGTAFLYSDRIQMPSVPESAFLFGAARRAQS
jgi:Spy/CpxP family protein refolding chaperone